MEQVFNIIVPIIKPPSPNEFVEVRIERFIRGECPCLSKELRIFDASIVPIILTCCRKNTNCRQNRGNAYMKGPFHGSCSLSNTSKSQAIEM